MNKLFVAALLFPLVAHAQIIGPVPTCDPSDPNCTIDNGCNGKACVMPTINLFKVTQVSNFK